MLVAAACTLEPDILFFGALFSHCIKFSSSTDLERLQKLLKRPIDLRQPSRCGRKKGAQNYVAKLALQGHGTRRRTGTTKIGCELLLTKGNGAKRAARVKRLMKVRRSIMARG